MKLYIKNMVSLRCKMMVEEELSNMGLTQGTVVLGMVDLPVEFTNEQRLLFKNNLLKSGLELLDHQQNILVERIKNVIVAMIHDTNMLPEVNFSEYVSGKMGYDYTYLANVFSEIKGISIQQFIILHKIERVKELLGYKELNLSQISYKLGYSSVSHLSAQFKKVTGLTPTSFKMLEDKKRSPLEDV